MDKEYLDFVERMGSFEFELGLDDIGQDDNIAHSKDNETLQHHGIKGMKWGVRRSDAQLSKARGKGQNAVKKRIGEQLSSMSRERSWGKKLKDMENMSNDDLNKMARRIQLENDLKRLSKSSSGVSTKNDREDYRKRESLSDQDLNMKVNRLRAKANFARTVSDASKEQRDFGRKVVNTAAGVGLRYALTGTVSTKDLAKIGLKSGKKNYLDEVRNIGVDKALDYVDRPII